MAARLEELRQQTSRREGEILAFRERIESANGETGNLAEEIELNTTAAEQIEIELETASASRAGILEAINVAEKEASEIRLQVTKVTEQKGKEEISSTKFELRMESVLETMQERYQINLAMFQQDTHELLTCVAHQRKALSRGGADIDMDQNSVDTSDGAYENMVVPGDEGPDWEFVETALLELKRKLDSMGPVNVDAIQEYEELEERFGFVKGQFEDLTNSKEELVGVIERINIETRKRFSETFSKIRHNFQDMFKLLFGEKGQADLHLVDENDPLESGIDVIAKPPGKKWLYCFQFIRLSRVHSVSLTSLMHR